MSIYFRKCDGSAIFLTTHVTQFWYRLTSSFHLSATLLLRFSTDCCVAEYRLLLGFTQTFMLETATVAAQLNCEASTLV